MFPWLSLFLVFITLEKIWFRFLDHRQFRRLKQRKIPEELEGVISKDEFNKSVDYSLDKLRFSVVDDSLSFIIHFCFCCFYFFPFLWRLSQSLNQTYLGISNEYADVSCLSPRCCLQLTLQQLWLMTFLMKCHG